MKKIEAIIRPHKMEDVREALDAAGVLGITITEVKGVGRQKGHTETYRGSEYEINFVPNVKLDIVVPDNIAQKIVSAIVLSAKTGEIGDGKIFISPVEDAIRIRTEESKAEAL